MRNGLYGIQETEMNRTADTTRGISQLDAWERRRRAMVEEQIISRGVKDPLVLRAMRTVPRHKFVPPSLENAAYDDSPLPVGFGQTISQPYIVAVMTELLNIDKDSRVLEIGTGTGYQTAVLAEICRHVFSVEVIPELAERAERTLRAMGYKNISIKTGDGFYGWPEEAPFDGIILTAAPEEVPYDLLQQITDRGRMVLPVGPQWSQMLVVIERNGDDFKKKDIFPVRFVPMVRGK